MINHVQSQTHIKDHLVALYGSEAGNETNMRLQKRLQDYARSHPSSNIPFQKSSWLSEKDSILITYADQVKEKDKAPLDTLAEFLVGHVSDLVSTIHILPFSPSSSDDGFSVLDYLQVEPDLGTWRDVERIGDDFNLMFDAVINHASAQGEWFRGFLRDDPRSGGDFIVVEGEPDLSGVVRPRATPLLTKFSTASGERKVWTTFSADQVDLNYQNPEVLLKIIDILLEYIAHGAKLIRLDAIAYLWKEISTPCIHLPQTHRIIQLFRAILDRVAPGVLLVTETNVPHKENVSYFGDGENEAQVVYNFALPPLVLHTLLSGDARKLSNWAASLDLPSKQVTFLNFLASHDGIGLNPARDILDDQEINFLVQLAEQHAGYISYKSDQDGSRSPYELNINYFDALSDPSGNTPMELQVRRFMTTQAIMLALVGIPGIYFHSLFGSRGWRSGVQKTGKNRTINRQKLRRQELVRELAKPDSLRYHIFQSYANLLKKRASSAAFHPHGEQQVHDLSGKLFALTRRSPDNTQRVLCLSNVSDNTLEVQDKISELLDGDRGPYVDLISGSQIDQLGNHSIQLQPFQNFWLTQGDC